MIDNVMQVQVIMTTSTCSMCYVILNEYARLNTNCMLFSGHVLNLNDLLNDQALEASYSSGACSSNVSLPLCLSSSSSSSYCYLPQTNFAQTQPAGFMQPASSVKLALPFLSLSQSLGRHKGTVGQSVDSLRELFSVQKEILSVQTEKLAIKKLILEKTHSA
jgi:hypothetical protein